MKEITQRYRVNWRYASDAGGLWNKGEIVELTIELAELIDRDSPGVLSAIKEDPKPITRDIKQPEHVGKPASPEKGS